MKHLNYFIAATGATSLSLSPELGQITIANSAQNYAGSLAAEVQGYLAGLAGLSDDEEMIRLNALFPGLQVNDFFQFAKADDEAYLTEADDSDIRAIGASFKRVQYKGTIVTDATQQKGLTMRVDHKTLPKVNGEIVPGWENRYAAYLRGRLIRVDKVRGLSLLNAGSNSVAVTWSGATNPDGDLRAMVQRTRSKSGLLPTHVVLGNAAQQGRQDSYEAAARVNHAMANHAAYSMEQLASYLGAGKALVEDGLKQVAKAAAKVDTLGLVAYSYNATESPIINDPSHIKRAWSPVKGGGEWAVAIQEHDVYTDITVWHESKLFLPMTSGIEKLTVTIG